MITVSNWPLLTRIRTALAQICAETGRPITATTLREWGRPSLTAARAAEVEAALAALAACGWATIEERREPFIRRSRRLVTRRYYGVAVKPKRRKHA